MRLEPYEVIFSGSIGSGKVPVRVIKSLCWVEIEVRNTLYCALGRSANPNHLWLYDDQGYRSLATLELVLRNILRCPPGDDTFRSRLSAVQPVIAAYREAKAKAHHFDEHWREAENENDLEREIRSRLQNAEQRRASTQLPGAGIDDELVALRALISVDGSEAPNRKPAVSRGPENGQDERQRSDRVE